MIAPSEHFGGGELPRGARAKAGGAPALPKSAVLDTANHFIVSVSGDRLFIQRVPIGPLSKAQALNLAAWLAVLADPEGKEFARLVAEIRKT